MNLCNIHFHRNAEHAGGEFTEFASNGVGSGYGTGFRYAGDLNPSELKPVTFDVCPGKSKHGGLKPGDTIEVHYVHSSAQVKKVNIASVAQWCEGNVFAENHAHGVRNPELLSRIEE